MPTTRIARSVLLATAFLTPAFLSVSNPASAQTTAPAPAPAPNPTPTPTPPATTAQRPIAPLAGTVDPSWGSIRTFTGDINPYWGSIRTFNGELSPYWGSIRTFWGDASPFEGNLEPFWGSIRTFTEDGETGQVAPNWGSIRTFWGDVGASWGSIRTFWGSIRTFQDAPQDYKSLADQLNAMVGDSQKFWGDAVQASTGKSFADGFANPMLSKYGINLKDPSSLAKLDSYQRDRFFLDWYDGLMNFSGADHVDHWMKQISWTPKLTQVQGSGTDAVIGLVDFYAAKDPDVVGKMIYSGGYTNTTSSHGAGVLSLIVASHDGKGVMGIAPNAKIAAYNPFDTTNTASWDDVKTGIVEVGKRGAAVINLSLGVPGTAFSSDWRGVFSNPDVKALKDKTLYVIAAGNTGTVQTSNIEMKDAFESAFLLVGSVGPDGKISPFSNTPGYACLTDGGVCKDATSWSATSPRYANSDYLKQSGLLLNHFIVAPGEFILVSDGLGGVQRVSGTSFAAPLVAGTVALIHDRWPWLKNYPRDVAQVILESATDLGAPGPDPVYGMGMLNAEAAQSVLDFSKLKYFLPKTTQLATATTTKTTDFTEVKVDTLRQTGIQSSWVTNDMYFSAFEQLNKSQRDFLIPLSSRLVGTMRNGQYFQEFVYNRFMTWLGGGSSLAPSFAPFGKGFSNLQSTAPMTNVNGWSMKMTGRLINTTPGRGYFTPRLNSAVQMESPTGKFSFSFGQGDGSVFVGGNQAFQSTSDFDPYSGGANPLLGFASGGAHFATKVAVSPELSISGGVTQRRRGLGDDLLDVNDANDRGLIRNMGRYRSSATNVRVDYQPMRGVNIAASLTRLDEGNALLGVRSIEAEDMQGGSVTEGVTLSTDVNLGSGVSLFGTATGARTRTASSSAALQVAPGGMLGTAFQAGVSKDGLIGKNDHLRLSIAQPLTIESGSVEMQMVKVIDRETGEIGVATERFDIAGAARRRYVAELTYGVPMMDGRGSLSVFGRGELRQVDAQTPRLMLGTQAKLAF